MNIRVPRAPISELLEPVETWHPQTEASTDEIKYVDIGSVDQSSKVISGWKKLLGSEAPSRARQLLKAGDVIVSTVRPNLNTVALVEPGLNGATASTGFCVLRANSRRLDNAYLFHWVKSDAFIAYLCKHATGASYPAVSDKVVKSGEIPLPRLQEQRRIASILDRGDAMRRAREWQLNIANNYLRSAFFNMFGDPVHNIALPRMPLGEIVAVSSGQGLTSRNMQSHGQFAVYGGNGVCGHHTEFMFEEPKVTIGRVGIYCGAVHLTTAKSWVTDNALVVREVKRPMNLRYLEWSLRIADLNQYAGRAAQPLISGGRIYPVEILVPTIEDQERFGAIAERFAVVEAKIQEAQELHKSFSASLSTFAFSGRL